MWRTTTNSTLQRKKVQYRNPSTRYHKLCMELALSASCQYQYACSPKHVRWVFGPVWLCRLEIATTQAAFKFRFAPTFKFDCHFQRCREDGSTWNSRDYSLSNHDVRYQECVQPGGTHHTPCRPARSSRCCLNLRQKILSSMSVKWRRRFGRLRTTSPGEECYSAQP